MKSWREVGWHVWVITGLATAGIIAIIVVQIVDCAGRHS